MQSGMFGDRKDFIDLKSYMQFAGPDWPTYQQVLNNELSANTEIQQEVDEFVAMIQTRVRDLRITESESLALENQQRQGQVFCRKQVDAPTGCTVPWNTMGVNSSGHVFICSSPSWIPKFLGNILDSENLFDLLNNELARRIRHEVLVGSYYYCNSRICSYFRNKPHKESEITSTTAFRDSPELYVNSVPSEVVLDFDYTCNFKCPSCRTELINWNDDFLRSKLNTNIVSQVKRLIIDQAPVDRVTTIRWAGGEPFMSSSYMELFDYIVTKGNRQIQNIVQTNGSMLKSKTAINLLPYIKTLRISYDAATESTYSKIRVNGNWAKLLENTKFILDKSSQYSVEVRLDFVVQSDNFREIPAFIRLCKDFGVQYNIQRMWNWGTWPQTEFDEKNVWNPAHTLYSELIDIFKSEGMHFAEQT